MRRLVLAVVVALVGTPGAAHAQAPLAWYTFDDGTAVDVTGNGNDGFPVGSPTPTTGLSGLALRFDGGGDQVTVNARPSLNAPGVSLSLWILLEEEPRGDVILVQKLNSLTGYKLGLIETGALRMQVSQNGATVLVTSPYRLVPGVWTPIYASYDGAELALYIHGRLVAAVAAAEINVVNNVPLILGTGFIGLMDEVKVGPGGTSPRFVCTEAMKIWHMQSDTCLERLEEVGASLGVDDLEHQTFGTTLVDVNQDGWLDLYYVNGLRNPAMQVPPSGTCPDLTDPPTFPLENRNAFYLNAGDGTFLSDSAPQMGLDDPWNAMRNVWADYDNDGDRDLFSHNFIVSTMYRNISETGELRFKDGNDVSGLHVCQTSGTGASWADINNDGLLDLFAVEYTPTRPPEEHVNQLFLQGPPGTFIEITDAAGVGGPNNPMGIAFSDYDNDGDLDVFMSNSHEQASRLYRNDGVSPGGIPRFTDVAPEAGLAVSGGTDRGFGGAWGDFNNDGFQDLLFIREFDSRLFRNLGPDGGGIWRFQDVTGLSGLDLSGSNFHGGNLLDLDNDGWLDIVLAAWEGPNRVFLGSDSGDGSWREVSEALLMDRPELVQRGVVPGDIDNDGDLDLVFTTFNLGDPNLLFHNESRGNNWVQFRLTGVESNRDAVGARIEILTRPGPGAALIMQTRDVVAGTGFFSDIPRIQTFGLGHASDIVEARVRWPGGLTQDLGPLGINQRHDISEQVNASGAVPDGDTVPGPQLMVDRDGAVGLTLTWGESCNAGDTDYAVYEGALGDFSSHIPATCSTAGATTVSFFPPTAGTYYLVVPRTSSQEGSYGVDSQGIQRDPSRNACAIQLVGSCQ